MPTRTIAVLFEYATLNGGERSMLAAIDSLRMSSAEFAFVAIAPAVGPFAQALHERAIPITDWSMLDERGCRHSTEQIQDQLVTIVTQLRPQLLHANSLTMGRLAGQVSSRLGIPTTAHLRDIIKLSAASIADLNRNERLVAVSNATREFHVAQGINTQRVAVVHNGVDLESFRPRIRTGRLLAELPLLPGPPAKLIATIGQIGLRKGQEILAAAAPAIVEHVSDAHFVLIGERSSQKQESVEFEAEIHRSFEQAGLSSHLHFLGYRNDVDRLLNEIDVLVHPAHQEPFGRVLLEASAAGVPIVATNVGGTSEIVVDGVTGFLVPRADPNALAMSVIQMLTNQHAADQMRKAARQRAEQQFSISTAAQNLAMVWDEVLN